MNSQSYNLYIETDEEVTTIISRLYRASASQIALIVPQHALLLQSVINLRLLAREAKKQSKNITLVTPDEEGMLFAERVGIVSVPLQEWQAQAGAMNTTQDTVAEDPRRTSLHQRSQSQYEKEMEEEMPLGATAQDIGSGGFFEEGKTPSIHQEMERQKEMPVVDVTHTEDIAKVADELEHVYDEVHQGQSSDIQNIDTMRYVEDHEAEEEVTQVPLQQEAPEKIVAQPPQNTARPQMDVRTNGRARTMDVAPSARQQIPVQRPQMATSEPREKQPVTQQQSEDVFDVSYEDTISDENMYDALEKEEGGKQHMQKTQQMFQAPPAVQQAQGDQPRTTHQKQPPQNNAHVRQPFNFARDEAVEKARVDFKPREEKRGGMIAAIIGFVPAVIQKVTRMRKDKNDAVYLDHDAQISRVHNFVKVAIVLVVFVIASVIFLPYSRISVHVAGVEVAEKISLTAKTSFTDVDAGRRTIPLRLIEKDVTRTVTAEATGKADVDAQKAFGTLTVYNVTTSAQPLVATTRFETEEGVVFRLAKATTIPAGTKDDSGEIVPGKVDVSVEADVAGSEGNIGPAKWKIPGFKGSAKYDTFYAENTQAMNGGNAAGEGASVATEEDIKKLEDIAQIDLGEYFAGEVQSFIREGEEVLIPGEQTVQFNVVRSESLVQPGAAVEEVSYVVTAKVQAVVFVKEDLDRVIDEVLATKTEVDFSDLERSISYDDVKVSFDDEKLTTTVQVSVSAQPELNVEEFGTAIQGVHHDDLADVVKKEFPHVKEFTITTYPNFPTFIGKKISRFGWMTEVSMSEDVDKSK